MAWLTSRSVACRSSLNGSWLKIGLCGTHHAITGAL